MSADLVNSKNLPGSFARIFREFALQIHNPTMATLDAHSNNCFGKVSSREIEEDIGWHSPARGGVGGRRSGSRAF